MIGFLLKKTFFDLWDNLFKIAFLNLGFILSAAVPLLLPSVLAGVPVLAFAAMALGVLWCFVYLSAASRCVRAVSDYSSFGFAEFFEGLKDGWLPGLVLGAVVLGLGLFASVALPFYLGLKSIVGVFAAALVFWTLVVVFLALQYFFPVRARLDRDLRKVFKKCFLIFFDNPGLSLFAVLHDAAVLALSFFLAFMAPGPAGVLLFLDEALRLRLMKYDWLEANPDADRRKVPWDELLVEEREKTGTRSLKSFIFPWKD